jgi:energy-coupling factor transport system substrate-specific component
VHAVGWGLVAPVLDILIYAEPADKVFTQGLIAGVGNFVFTAIVGTLLLYGYAKTRVKTGSLE